MNEGHTVDHVVRLRDGRSMGYAQFGAPDGFVIVNAHGGLASRLDVAAADDAATANGVRLISPDRARRRPVRTRPWAHGAGLGARSEICLIRWASTNSPRWDGPWAGNTLRRSLTACANA